MYKGFRYFALSKIDLLSEILNISQRRIQQLADEGIIPKPEKAGDYDIPVCVQNYYERIYANDDESLDGRHERARKAKVEADRIEFELDIKKGNFVQADLISFELERVIANCRAKLLALPRKAAVLVVTTKTPAEAEEILTNIVNEALDELATLKFDESNTRDTENPGDNM